MGNCQGQARSSIPSNLSAQVKPTMSTMGVSPPWQPALKTLVIDPTEKHTATVVFLHGLGDTGQGWGDDLPSFNLKHIKWIVPTAETRPITWNGGERMNGWFDVRGLGPGTHEDVEGLDRAAAHVVSLLEEERAAAGPDSPILYGVGGFSQGGSLALHVATSLAYGRYLSGRPTPDVPLAAALCISGWLRGSDTLLKTPLSAEALQRAASLPILHCHGTADPTVSFRLGKDTADTLKGVLGFSRTTFKPYMLVGHHIVPEEVADICKWMLTHLPPT